MPTEKVRQHAIASKGASQGELQGKIVFPKHTEEWVATPILEKTNRDHLSPVLVAIIARQNQKPWERRAPHAVQLILKTSLANLDLLKGKSPQGKHQDLQTFKLLSFKGVVAKFNLHFKSFWWEYC